MAIPSNIIYKTIDHGRTHLAKDDTYIGNVNSYNNCISRFFARLFRKTIDVQINGKTLCLNQKSYVHLLNRFGVAEATYENAHQYVNLAALNVDVPEPSRMRDHLTAGKIHSLTKKLINRIGNHDKAMKYVGQGADVNAAYWERGNYGISFDSFKKNLPVQPLNMLAQRFTPFSKATASQDRNLANFMLDVGAVAFEGEVINFKREITNVRVEHLTYLTSREEPVFVHDRMRRTRYVGNVTVPALKHERVVHTTYHDLGIRTHVTHADQYFNYTKTAVRQVVDDSTFEKIT